MAYSYGTQGAPAVGGGAPGLPKRGRLARGHVVFDIPGTYRWTVPEGVYGISMVAVGAGSAGSPSWSGHGGGLGWKNRIAVKPGDVLTVVVGASGTTVYGAGSKGTDSAVFLPGGSEIVAGRGGADNNVNSPAGYSGDGGGAGGVCTTSYGSNIGGGGGAGGYTGAGGTGGTGTSAGVNAGTAGAGGGGGGGGASAASPGNGGGVGLFGLGSNGNGGAVGTDGGAGSNGVGKLYGGGGGKLGAPGGSGAVRIVWPGDTRLFPSSDVSAS